MNIPFLPLSRINSTTEFLFTESLPSFFSSGRYLLGANLREFELAFSVFCNTKYAVGVGNGLDAIKLLLLSKGIGAGDEVIVPSNTFIATWIAVSEVGATPIPVDCSTNSHNLDPYLVKNAISTKTKAIIAVHLYGEPCEMDEINAIAKSHNLLVFEDAAQAHGATYKQRLVGSLADGAAFSFYPGKNLGGIGDGGGITTNDSFAFEKLIALRNYGSNEKYIHIYKGINSRLDDIQAIFLNIKLKLLMKDNISRLNVANFYLTNIKNPLISLPTYSPNSISAWHLFVIRCSERDRLKSYLASQGIETIIHYPIPPHLQPAYADRKFSAGDFPNTEAHCNTCLSLPIHPLITPDEMHYISSKVNSFN